MFRRVRIIVAALVAPWLIMIALGMFGIRPAAAAPALQTGPITWTAYMGHEAMPQAGSTMPAWEMDAFYPANLTIHVGDSVMWKHNSMDNPHTVTFLGPEKAIEDLNGPPAGNPPRSELNPKIFLPVGSNTYDGSQYLNSGVMADNIPGPKQYTVTFNTPGTYTYYCSIHAVNLPNGQIVSMQAKVTVLPAGSALPMTPAQVEAQARSEMAANDQEAMQADAQANQKTATTSVGPNGNTVYHVNVGYQILKPTSDMDYMRFAPSTINVKVGDTVEWSIPTAHGFHNVLFGDANAPIFNIEPQQSGPPKAYLNNEVFGPVGANPGTYAGTGVASAGIVVGKDDLAPGAPFVGSYALTFTQPGSYNYVCALHDEMGMKAVVNVSSAGGMTPGMPTTGGGPNWDLLLLAISLGVTALVGGLVLRFRGARAER